MKSRDERIEEYYDNSAWDLAERLVNAEDEGARLLQRCVEVARQRDDETARADLNGDLADDWARRAGRYRLAWKSARTRVKWACWSACSELRFTRNMWADTSRDLHRYRLAWLSARRRAAEEAALGAQAVDELRDARASSA
ncbi:hypothetical protein [Streptomyces sp. SM8]|uniref:hypothetical protein n=1 Tax=Streptomyces sp. SM8 TaxID=1195457 RepID=UPI000283111B|nr:hypothetical protein [Streptomyces sp. SM8]PKA37922.1 hypothetical protein SM8_029310 [Streptomyces sp. SM8]